jgi:hypothetical protein
MANITETSAPPAHRYRSQVGMAVLLVALALGPLAWIGQLFVAYCVASHACFPDGAPLLDVARAGLWWALLIINLVGVALAATAGLASLRNYRVAQAAATGARPTEIRLRVEGRAEFLAGWGGICGFIFFIGALFDLIALLIVPPCLG